MLVSGYCNRLSFSYTLRQKMIVARIVTSIFSLTIGVLAFARLLAIMEEFYPVASMRRCLLVDNHIYPFGLPAFDTFMCVIHPLFAAANETDQSSFIASCLLNLLLSFWLVSAIESTRSTAHALVWLFGTTTALSHLIGVGPVVTILWLPCWVWTRPSRNEKLGSLLPAKIYTIAAVMAGVAVSAMMLKYHNVFQVKLGLAVATFHLLSLLAQPIWWTLGISFKPSIETADAFITSSNVAATTYRISSIILGLQWIKQAQVITGFLLEHGYGSIDALKTLLNGLAAPMSLQEAATCFFLVDLALLWLGCLMWIGYEMGLCALISNIFWTAVMGPGASFLRTAEIREYLLSSSRLAKDKVE